MAAVNLAGREGFARLALAFVEIGAAEYLPALPTVGATDVNSALAKAGALVQAGVPAEVVERLASWVCCLIDPMGLNLAPKPF